MKEGTYVLIIHPQVECNPVFRMIYFSTKKPISYGKDATKWKKKYINIVRLRPRHAAGFQPGDQICVEEKIDGANLSLFYDEIDDQLRAFGRKTELDEKNNLRGAWEWCRNWTRRK